MYHSVTNVRTVTSCDNKRERERVCVFVGVRVCMFALASACDQTGREPLFVCLFICLLERQPPPPVGQGLLIHDVSRSHNDSSGRVISPSQRPLPEQHTILRQTSMHPCGIRTHCLSKRAVADPRLRPRGHWDRHANTWKTLHTATCSKDDILVLSICYEMSLRGFFQCFTLHFSIQ